MDSNPTSSALMEMINIRVDATLKRQLKMIAGDRGYHTLIRDVLTRYVDEVKGEPVFVAVIPAIAHEHCDCIITHTPIPQGTSIYLGVTRSGDLLPVSVPAYQQMA